MHRDVKPHNLLLNCDLDWNMGAADASVANGGWQCLLSDFGIMTRLNGAEDVSRTLVGTLQYMSPERLVGASYSYPSDGTIFGSVCPHISRHVV